MTQTLRQRSLLRSVVQALRLADEMPAPSEFEKAQDRRLAKAMRVRDTGALVALMEDQNSTNTDRIAAATALLDRAGFDGFDPTTADSSASGDFEWLK